MKWQDHVPKPGTFRGDGVELCGECQCPFDQHRVKHKFRAVLDNGEPVDECETCSLPARLHRKTSARRSRGETKEKTPKPFYGVDGEGCGRDPHRYVMLCAASEKGREFAVENPKGLTTEQCLDFLLDLPTNARYYGFAFNYDLTKMLKDLEPEKLYWLNHPEGRTPQRSAKNPYPRPMAIVWQSNGKTYHINLLSSRFEVRLGKRKTVIWDIFRFFGTSFVRALQDWDVGTQEERDRILAMKKKRGLDDWMESPTEVDAARAYCFSECRNLGVLARKLVEAHDAAGLDLKKFYGAGSSADAMLAKIGIKESIVKEPREMFHPVRCAFFGGRFENSVVGEIRGKVYNLDIASAYPYQITWLPCLVHSKWMRTRSRPRIETARAALVKYRLGKQIRGRELTSWGPLPFRTEDGSIVYPVEGGCGWVWRDEYLMAERMAPHLEFLEAYILDGDCDCQPFEMVPQWYRERLHIGKEGAGLVFKLGPNSIYGKLAQSIGANPPYQSFVWAGITTSGTRAQLGSIINLHKDPSNALATATDGIVTRELIEVPEPRETGTSMAKKSAKEIAASKGKICKVCKALDCELAHKPLGSWEMKTAESGVFFARPGIYFDLEGVEEGKAKADKVRARGVGRDALLANLKLLSKAWRTGDPNFIIPESAHARFWGMKSSIRMHPTTKEIIRSDRYGEWVDMPVEISFDPLPKREGIRRVPGQNYGTLGVRKMPLDIESSPYLGKMSPEAQMMAEAKILATEQPDIED